MKKYTSWGEFIEVRTTGGGKYSDVVLCPDPDNESAHLLESRNGDVIRVLTANLHGFRRYGSDMYYNLKEAR
jgi:hypothetical protein